MKNRNSMSCLAKVFLISLVSLCFGLISGEAWTNPAHASNAGGLPACKDALDVCTVELSTCDSSLSTCQTDLAACQASSSGGFPGDGYTNPDAFGVSGHGPALSYTDNGDETFTDNVTKLTWEKKTDVSGSVHNVGNIYTWTNSIGGSAANGPLFTVFLHTLNNSCAGDETTSCTSDTDCTGIGNGKCGFAGHRDWRIPNIKELQTIVDYSMSEPASSVPGLTAALCYWSVTSYAPRSDFAWCLSFTWGNADFASKNLNEVVRARAVRP